MENDLILALLHAAIELIPVNPAGAQKLVRGAAALYESGVLEPEPPAQPDAPCKHPQDQRKSLATHGKPNAWMCRACDHIED
jgi:hypothetical protein